jgi:2-polyprenyl-3-methyl-5-hydroxy-6-metoxy-1,4-benzoquinol methylase
MASGHTRDQGALPGRDLYDDPAFFARYQLMRATRAGLNHELEQPALMRMLPAVHGASVIELGCGDGALARRLADAGAEQVLAVDSSRQMLALAASRPHPRVRYRRDDIETLSQPAASTDCVVSSLALHYVRDYAGLIGRVARWLRPGSSVRKYHRRLTTVVGAVLAAGLTLTGLDEPWPGDEAVARRPDLAQHRRRPPLLLVAAAKPPHGQASRST